MIDGLLTQPVTITRRTSEARDSYGNVRLTDAAPVATVGLAQQNGETDNLDSQDQAAGDWWLYLPAGTAIDRNDRATVAGLTLEVVGRPRAVTRGTTGVVHHIEARCRLVEG